MRAIPRRACATLSSEPSSSTGGNDSSAQVSALMVSGSIVLSNSSMRCHIVAGLEFVLSVASSSMTNCVADTMALRNHKVSITCGTSDTQKSGAQKRSESYDKDIPLCL